MKGFLIKIRDFFLCLLEEDCKYSIKKTIAWIFVALILYMEIFTIKPTYEYLVFLSLLLGLREYTKGKINKQNNDDYGK